MHGAVQSIGKITDRLEYLNFLNFIYFFITEYPKNRSEQEHCQNVTIWLTVHDVGR